MGKNFSCNNATGKRKASDFYETPYSLTRLLLRNEKLPGLILEPAAGGGAITRVLVEFGYQFIQNDINDSPTGYDYLKDYVFWKCDTMITNPPFSLAEEFISQAKRFTRKKIIMLLPLSYLHGVERFKKIFSDKNFPLKRVYVFTRYPMLGEPLRDDGKVNTGMMVYAWYVWEKTWIPSLSSAPKIYWLDNDSYILRKSDR